ncbi:MAG TPA: carboxypeptidase-like regulatory domain-containing protein, partial [Elusimicrobiales bacterium]|nr:carboxypeptidase-like regulatory domain-containing protein [Elusimicrobiales bacterium]
MTDPGEPSAFLPSYVVTGTTAAVLTMMDPGQMAGGNIGEISGIITYGGHQGGNKIVRLFRGSFGGAPIQTLDVTARCLGNSCNYTLPGLSLAGDYYVDAFVDTSFNAQYEPAAEPYGRIAFPISLSQATPVSRNNYFTLDDPGTVIVSTGSSSLSGNITVRGAATGGVIRTRLYAYSGSRDAMQVPVRVATYSYSGSAFYSFPDLPAGSYLVQAYADHDGDFVADSTEAWGQSRTTDNGIGMASPEAQKSFSICVRAPITAGQTLNGSLETSDCFSSERSAYEDRYSFQGRAGDIVTAEMLASGFSDTYLYLYGPVVTGTNTYTGGSSQEPNAYNLLAADDDGAGNLNSRISGVILPRDGVYTIGAASYGNNITGAYTMSLRVSGGSNGSIAGTVRYNGTQGGSLNVGLFNSDPRNSQGAQPVAGASMNVPGDFAFSDLPTGTTYYIAGFVDVNANNSPDSGEDFGLYPNPVTLRIGQNVSGLLLEINASTEAAFAGGAGQGTISGAISYAGASTATALVIEMWNTSTFRGMPVGIRTVQVSGEWPLAYDLQVPGDQTYYLKAFLDSNGDRMPDMNEAKGAYEPNNEGPEPIYVGSAAYVSDRDFALYDPGQSLAGGAGGAAGEGWASVLPASVPAGSQFTATVTVRVNGLGDGGTVLVGLPGNLWSSLITGCPSCPGDVTVSLDGTAYDTTGLTIPPPPPGSFMPSNTARYQAPAGGLAPGTSVYFAIRNLYAPCQGGMTGAMGQTDNTLRFHVGTSSSAAIAPQPLINGEPVATLSAGAPQNMSFRLAENSNNYNMAVPNGEATAMVAEARDNCWNPALMPSVYIATVSAYAYDMASSGYVLDNTVKFSSWSADGNNIPNTSTAAAVRFEAGSSTGTFYIKPTAQGYRNVGLSYDLGWPNTFYMGVQVMAGGGITGANVSTGVYNNFSASSMTVTITPDGDGNSDRAYINFVMADPNMGWHVAVSSIPYGRGVTPTPVWETWGWGQPSPGQIFWEGRYSPWMNYGGVLPTGAYFVRLEAGSLRNDSLRINVVVPQVSGQVTDAGTTPPRPLSGVSVNAYGMSGWGQATTDSGGNYAIPGLAQGQYNFQFSKEEYGMVSSQTVIGSNGGALSVSMRRAPALILIPSLVNGATQQYDQWGWINVHTENWDRVYNGSLRIPASTSAASVAYIDDGGRWDAATGQFVTRRRIRFDVEPSTYSIEAELPGYGRVYVSSYVGSAGLELALPAFTRKANVSGLVSLPSSNPNGTWVSVNAMPIVPSTSVMGGWGGVWMNQGVTVSTYNIYGLDPGTYTIRAQVPGYSGVSSGPVIVGAADINGLDMPQFGEGKVIRGTVTVVGDTSQFTKSYWMNNWTHPIRVNVNVWSPQTYTNGWTEIYAATSTVQSLSTFTITGLDAGTTYQLFANIDYNRDGGGAEFTVPGGFPKQVYVGAGGGDSEFSFALASGAIAGTILLPLDPAPDFSQVGMGVRITRSDNPYNLGEHFYMPDISAPCGEDDKCLPGFSSNTATGEAAFQVTGMETQTIEVTFNYGLTGISRTAMVNVVSGSTSTVVVDLRNNTYPIYGSVTNQISNPSFNTMAAAIANSSFTFPSGYPMANDRTYLPIEAVRRDLTEFGVAISTTFDPAKTRVGYITQAGTYTITGLQDGVYVVRTLPLRLCTTCEMLVAPQEKVVTIRGADYANNRRVLVDGVYVGTGSVNFTLIDGWNVGGTIAIENSVQDARTLRLTLRNRRNEVVRSTSVALGNAATNSLANSAAYSFTRLPGGEFYTLEVRDTRDSNGLTKYVAAPLRFPDIGTSPNGMQSDLTGQNVTLKQGAMVTLKLRDLNSATLLTQSNYSLLAPNFACFATANPWVQGGYYVAASSISGRPIEADGTVRIGPVMPGVYYDVRCEQSSWDVGYMRTGAQNYSPAVVAGVRPSAGETRDLGVLDLKQGQALTGDVRDRSGQPLGNIKVVAKPSYIENPIQVQAMTNREGRYSLCVST